MPEFGGRPSGRPSKFRFAAGTPEGDEERRKADSDRKAAARAVAAKMVEPPPLPSAESSSMVGPVQAPDGDPLSGAGDPLAPPGVDLPVPWDPEQLKPLLDELIDTAEAGRVEKFRGLANEAQFPPKVASEIAGDAKYAPALKKSMQLTAPRVVAKAANRIGISGRYSDEGILATALLANYVQGRRLMARLEKLIAEQKAAQKKEEKKL